MAIDIDSHKWQAISGLSKAITGQIYDYSKTCEYVETESLCTTNILGVIHFSLSIFVNMKNCSDRLSIFSGFATTAKFLKHILINS